MKKFCILALSVLLVPNAFAHDIVLRDQGKAFLGVSYPSDWKQVVGKSHVIATSEDGQAWSVISTLDEIQDQDAGVLKIKSGLEDYLKDIQYDEAIKTDSGSLILSGTAKGKQSEVDVVFTSAVFMSGTRHCGLVFIIDADIEKFYEKTVLAICESVLIESDFDSEMNDEMESNDSADRGGLHAQPWLVEDIAGRGVVDRAQTTIQFTDDGAVSGSTCVNRYRGQAKIDGDSISFGPLAATRRAGPPALMEQETKFLKAISTVKRYRIEATGLLFLIDEAGESVLRLSPMDSAKSE